MTLITCNQQKLNDYLEAQLSGSDEEAVVTHLDHCDHCREFIQDQAASLDSWVEVTELLGDWRRENVPSTVAVPVRGVLDSLTPTDDPSMLGRLGPYEISGVVGTGGRGEAGGRKRRRSFGIVGGKGVGLRGAPVGGLRHGGGSSAARTGAGRRLPRPPPAGGEPARPRAPAPGVARPPPAPDPPAPRRRP